MADAAVQLRADRTTFSQIVPKGTDHDLSLRRSSAVGARGFESDERAVALFCRRAQTLLDRVADRPALAVVH